MYSLARAIQIYGIWLCQSTGAEIETALCILESVLPTLVSPRYRHSEICGSLICCECDPRGVLGNSETRNLEFGSPSPLPWTEEARGGLGNSETRNLEFGGRPLGSDPRGGLGNSETRNLEYAQEYPGICTLGILESGICRGVSWNLPMRKHGNIWILGSLCGPTEGPRKLGNSESGICRGVSWSLHTWKHGIWILASLCRPTERPRKLGNSETRNLEFAIWKNLGFRAARLPPPPPPPRALGDRSSLPGPSPPWSTVGQPLYVNGHING